MCNRKRNIIEVRHKPMVDLSDTTLYTLILSRIDLRKYLIKCIETDTSLTLKIRCHVLHRKCMQVRS